MERRLTELETRYAYLEKLVEDLSRVLHDQQRLFDGMTARLTRIESLVTDALEQGPEATRHEKPPHY